jgi:hypothetical protein
MEKRLRKIEKKILLYFNLVENGCREYIKSCDYSPYFCGYSEPRTDPVNTYEVCLFVSGKIKCPGEIEKHYIDRRGKKTYRTIVRAIEGLEKKGYIEKTDIDDHDSASSQESKWYMTYKLAAHL